MLSVIIPALNEIYLEKTVRNILENAHGEIEIIVELDGYLPDPPIDIGDNRVIFVHHENTIGQRACVNDGARRARGEFIMKLDGHSAVAPGFDVQLAKDCKYEWTLIPRMYNLNIDNWKPKLHKKTDYMYISSPKAKKAFRAKYYTGSERVRLHRIEKPIDETMCCMGPGWFMHKQRFFDQGGCDEGHEGGWGQMGIEVACKAWLSGGALMVDKNTWFAHWFRGGSKDEKYSPGFPYSISGNRVERVRRYSRDLWLNNKWDKQVREFQWMVDKFKPPTWNGRAEIGPDVYVPRNAKSHVHGRQVRVKNLFDNLEHYWDDARKYRARPFIEKAIPFFRELAKGKTFTDEELIAHPYYSYISSGIRNNVKARSLRIMKDSISLFHDIKKNGMSAPIEMWVEDGKYNVSRGTRRIVILYLLGKRNTTIRIYKNKEYMEKFRFKKYGGRISAVGKSQFMRWGWKATDKYWIHDYLPYYDRHLPEDAKKVLEIGVKRGGSIMLWREAYPKATVYGMDIDVKQARLVDKFKPKDVVLLEGSQTDKEYNDKISKAFGPFDIIVDDASHIPSHQIKGLEYLWKAVVPGGWYIIEDLFYRNYHHKHDENFMRTLKGKIDEMNEKGDIEEMHFYYNICFIKKK